MRIGQIFLICLLAGCSSWQPVYRPVEVRVPIPVACRAPVVLHPVWPTSGLSEKASTFEQVRAVLAENELRKGYEERLRASLEACQ